MSGNVGLGTNKGSWNALKNAPAISNSTRNNSAGDYYTTSVAGTSSFTSRGRGQYFAVGDIIVFNGDGKEYIAEVHHEEELIVFSLASFYQIYSPS